MKNDLIIALLCAIMFSSNILYAQDFNLFAKQKVAVAEVHNNSDRKVDDGVRTMIKQGLIDACTNSDDYEVYEINMDDIRQQLTAKGLNVNRSNICKQIGVRADYIIFTDIKLSSSAPVAQDVVIYITATLYRIATASEMKTSMVEFQPSSNSLLSALETLFSKLLGVDAKLKSNIQQNTQTNSSANTQINAYANTQLNSYANTQTNSQYTPSTPKRYAIGDYYDVGGKQGVVFAVTPDGQHGKIVCLQDLGSADWYDAKSICANLGSGWRLPTKAELLAIYEVMGQLNSMLVALGDPIQKGLYWSSTEYDADNAWVVAMRGGDTYNLNKYYDYSVRAVSTF